MRIEARYFLEMVMWTGLVMTRTLSRVAGFVLEWLFVAATWIALFVVGAVMAFQRGGLRLFHPAEPGATSRSAHSTGRRTLRR
jgi:hypothetical protein